MSRFIRPREYTKEISEQHFSEAGTGVVPVYKIKVDLYGSDVLEQVGEHDLYAEIQSYKNDCDLSKVVELLGGSLDETPDPINFTDEVLDLTKIPRTLSGWQTFNRDMSDYWESLTPATRADVGNIYNLPDYIKGKYKEFVDSQSKDKNIVMDISQQNNSNSNTVVEKKGESEDGN